MYMYCTCHRNWRTPSSMEFHGISWNGSCQRNWRTSSSMEWHGIFVCYLMEPLASSIFWVLNLDRIPWNLSFVSLFHQRMLYYQYLHYTTCISGITHYVSKYHSKSLFNVHWNLFWSKNSMKLFPEFHGTFWTTFEQHLWFHGIQWNLSNRTPSSMEFHGIPWNFVQIQSSMEFHGTFSILPSSMEFHGIINFPKKVPWNFLKFHGIPWWIWYLKKHISKYCCWCLIDD